MDNVILAHKVERDRLLSGQYVLREGLEQARQTMRSDLVKVVTGPRRAGKSVFSIQLYQDMDFAYLNFDDERLMRVEDYDEYIKSVRRVYGDTQYLMFDEIQNLENWELFVNRLQRNGFRILITGSNSRLLSKELATHLTGRYIQHSVFTFSFREFLGARSFSIDDTIEVKETQGSLLRLLDEYVELGGYPEIVVKGTGAVDYLPTLFEGVLFKDIAKRYNVRYSSKLYDLANYLVTNHSGEFTFNRLKNVLGFRSVHTVENYVRYIADAFLVFIVERFSFRSVARLKAPRKVYAYDTGMANAVKLSVTPDVGKFMENVVAVESLRRKDEIYSYLTQTGKEVDFVLKKGHKVKQLIQVCYDISNSKTKSREFGALAGAAEELDCNNLLVITPDRDSEENFKSKRIICVSLWRWLLNLHSPR